MHSLFTLFGLLLLHVLFEFCFAFHINLDQLFEIEIASLGQKADILEIIQKAGLLLMRTRVNVLWISPFFGFGVDVNCNDLRILALKSYDWIKDLLTFGFLQLLSTPVILVAETIINCSADVEVTDVSNHDQKWLNIFLH
jgi:hypothetical protein